MTSAFQASLLDGCGAFRASFLVTIPLLRNIISMCAVLCTIGAVKEYPLIFVMTMGGPFKASYTPAILMYVKSFLEMDFGFGSAASVILIVISLCIYKLIHMVFPTREIQY